MRRETLLAILSLGLSAHTAFGQIQVEPLFSIWDVTPGQHVSTLPDAEVAEIACGTNGGPPGLTLVSFADFLSCPPEPSGLYEVAFTYDDEQDYIALALDAEFRFLHGGTSAFAHPVIVSVLVDASGTVQGRRIFTDDRISDRDRRTAVTLMRNFKARFGTWSLSCSDIAMKEGEQPVGDQFVHELCTGQSPDGQTRIAIQAALLRKKGQQGVNRETQEVNTGYFESKTRYEELLSPYMPEIAP